MSQFDEVPEAQAGGTAEGEDVGRTVGAPGELREEDVMQEDALDDRVREDEDESDDAE